MFFQVLQVVSGILHLGNVLFREEGADTAVIDADESIRTHTKCGKPHLKHPSNLLCYSVGLPVLLAAGGEGPAGQEADLQGHGVQVRQKKKIKKKNP